MTGILAGVRKGDVALAGVLTTLGVLQMVENIQSGADAGVRVDSHSWLMVPVFAGITVPILWRRRGMIPVLAVTAVALAVHVLAFGWVVRCGAGLPVAFALAYGAGRLSRGSRAYVGLAAAIAVQFLVLARDSAAGLAILPVTAALGLVAWGIGALLARRAARTVPAPAPAPAAAHA